MAETLLACLGWLRRRIGWSNSRQSWEERGAVVLMLAGAITLIAVRSQLSSGVLLALWALLILTGAALLRRGWLKLFGPVLFYDLVRIGRRTRHAVVRWLYVWVLGLVIALFYFIWRERFATWREPKLNDIIELNVTLFYTFMVVQLLTILLITPAYVAGAIAEEKDRKTLEFLLATDLRSREIVFGKTLARVLNIFMVVLAGLPILSILQVLGGVGPDLVLAGFAGTIMTVAGMAGLSVACSTATRRSRDAILLTYLALFAYGILSLLASEAMRGPWAPSALNAGVNWTMPWSTNWRINLTLDDVVQFVICGNPIVTIEALFSGPSVSASIATVMPRYFIFHAIAALAGPAWATWRLRRIAAREATRVTRLTKLTRPIMAVRPRVWPQSPMFWKELFIGSGLRMSALVRLIFALIVGLLFIGSFAVLGLALSYTSIYQSSANQANTWLRSVGTVVAVLMWLLIAVRASGSISGERDKLTWNELLVSPLSADAILFSKLVGAVLGVRLLWIWLGVIWFVGLVLGGLYVWAVPLLSVAWLIYATFGAAIGLWFSAHCKTTLRATVWTILTLGLLSVGHWILMFCFCYLPVMLGNFNGREVEQIVELEAGQTPPFVMGFLAFYPEDFRPQYVHADQSFRRMVLSTFGGLITWLTAAGGLLVFLRYRFVKMTNRMPASLVGQPWCEAVSRRR